MMFGLLVEYISVPKADIDRNKYKNPVGAQQFLEWREQAKEDQTFSVDYRRDKRALKLISQTEWEGDRPYSEVEGWRKAEELDKAQGRTPGARQSSLPEMSDRYVEAQRWNNYVR